MTDEKRIPPGRPSMYGTAASARVYLRVTPARRLALRRTAAARGTDVASLLREIIDEHEDRRPFPDVFRLDPPTK